MSGLAAALGQGGKDAAQSSKDMQAQKAAALQGLAGIEGQNNAQSLGLANSAYNLADTNAKNIINASQFPYNLTSEQLKLVQANQAEGYRGTMGTVAPSITEIDTAQKTAMAQAAQQQAIRTQAAKLAAKDRDDEAKTILPGQKGVLSDPNAFNARIQQYITNMASHAATDPSFDPNAYTPSPATANNTAPMIAPNSSVNANNTLWGNPSTN